MKKHNFLKLSLRTKLVLTLSIVVIAVACCLLYFTTKMILEDKKAYVYDTAFQSLGGGTAALAQYFDSKTTFVSVIQSASKKPEDLSKTQLATDKDLYQVLYLNLSVPLSERKVGSAYTNEEYNLQYRGRESFLSLSDDFMFLAAEEGRSNKYVEKLYYEKGKAPRLIILVHNSAADIVYCFDFLLDRLYDSTFTNETFEVSLVNSKGEFLFSNRPYEIDEKTTEFYRLFVKEKMKLAPGKSNAGVTEQLIGEEDYILGFKQVTRFPDHFLFSSIRSSAAFEVTSILILNTIVYTLILVGIFNLISILIARSITNPLDKLIDVIKTIAEGKFHVRVGEQSTTELQLVADSFNEMVNRIQEVQTKLIQSNKTLERKVRERTQDLKEANDFITTMVDSLAQGLLVFGRDGHSLDLYTRACIDLIGVDPTGRHLADLIKPEDKSLLNDWIENLFEEMIPFESLVELGQKSIPCNEDYRSINFKHITLEFFPMRDEDGKVINVVMVASDKTREFKAFKEVEAQQNYARLVSKVLKDKISFIRFTNLFEESLKRERSQIAAEGLTSHENFLRLIHSMKGSAAFYSLQDVVDYLHDFESVLLNGTLSNEDILKRIDESLLRMENSISALRDLIGDTSRNLVEIDEKKLRTFWNLLLLKDRGVAEEFAGQFLQKEVEHYISQYKELVLDLSMKLGKRIHPMIVENGNLLVDMNHYQEFFDSCIHIFRNVVDHAIEHPETRLSFDKPEEGTIKVTFDIIKSNSTSFLEFNVQDDGAGIDADRIRNKMRQLNYPPEIISKSDDQIIYHIFDANFSTAEQVSDISGRGVGLYDIKKNVEKLQGTIELQTKVGKGTVFSFLLPLPGNKN